jgi:hypothetical protein
VVAARPEIVALKHGRTIHTGPHTMFVAISADFDDSLTTGAVKGLIPRPDAQAPPTLDHHPVILDHAWRRKTDVGQRDNPGEPETLQACASSSPGRRHVDRSEGSVLFGKGI